MKRFFCILTLLLFEYTFSGAQELIVTPTAKQMEWADAEIGVIIHYDLVTYDQDYVWFKQWDYDPDPSIFNPTSLDTDQWVLAAKAAGAKYALLVAKHCVGFSLWPTKAHDYSVASTPWKNGNGDLVRDFINSCKKYDVKPGLYYSAAANGYLKVKGPGVPVPESSISQEEYNRIVELQLTELWSNYGDLFEIWFDGGLLPPDKGGPNVIPILKKHQPNAIVFQGPSDFNNLIRWVGNEEGLAPYPCWSTVNFKTRPSGVIDVSEYSGNPNGKSWIPGEADLPIRNSSTLQGGWFWEKEQESSLRPLEEMIDIYYKSVGRNTNVLLGIVVDDRGLVPEADASLLKEFGKSINGIFSKTLAETSGEGTEFILDLKKPTSINNVLLMEDINKGERVREYTVEAFKNDQWITLCKGELIGHKRLERIENISVSKIRISINKSIAKPLMKKIALY
ncbi:alpha-L-fucosidase [Flavivirga spongiicola]|uniref:alpha-L-fucosidase n=1 Tax=Flavivirga spongiicola TaxID=421621 RepID=A0ABU7XWP1_9FLAO|nr:alpha-L-fucosidase [Flavivirga sp. MEBiC05379]MDO5980189.1 alpha-L-fucosidase [Flavivirga sp. MEBiC05379]